MNTVHRIQFEKPDLNRLTKHFTVVDLHFHSLYSDGAASVAQIADRAMELGIGIAITDHNAIDGAVEIDRLSEVFSIPGIEITAREGTHLLIYFYKIAALKQFYKQTVRPFMGNGIMSSIDLTLETIIERARHFETVAIFPHPICAVYTGVCNPLFSQAHLERLLEISDGIEVINAGSLKNWNLKCAVLGFNLNKAIIGGSDGHTLAHMGKAVTFAECPAKRRAFLDAVKQGQAKVIGKEIDILKKMTANGFKLKSNLRNPSELFEKNLRYGYSVIHSKSMRLGRNLRRSLNGRYRKTG